MAGKYRGIEPGLAQANREIIQYDRPQTHWTKIQVEKIVKRIISAMKRESPVFARLYSGIFLGGSSGEGLRVGEGADFDIDVLLKMPEETEPVLREDVIPGFVQLQLQNFRALDQDEELFRVMSRFVDDRNFLLTTQMKTRFIQSIFDRARNSACPNNIITLGTRRYRILSVQNLGPALTLTIEGVNLDFSVEIDLVPCVLLGEDDWPRGGFRENPYAEPANFFIVPKRPRRLHPHIDRYFRLSFQMQEKEIMFDRNYMKPTIRLIKCVRDHFQHQVSSYAIKTLFLRELLMGNPELDDDTPAMWRGPLSNCFMHMLRRYLECLRNRRISCFWNNGLNLLDNLIEEQFNSYSRHVERALDDIDEHRTPESVLRYLTR